MLPEQAEGGSASQKGSFPWSSFTTFATLVGGVL